MRPQKRGVASVPKMQRLDYSAVSQEEQELGQERQELRQEEQELRQEEQELRQEEQELGSRRKRGHEVVWKI